MASVSSNQFSIDLFNRPLEFERFMSGEKELKNIAEMAKHPDAIIVPSKDSLYFGRWKVVWFFFSGIFWTITRIFCRGISLVLSCMRCTRLNRFFSVFIWYTARDDFHLDSQSHWKEKLLVPTYNSHQLTSWDVYFQNPIPFSQVGLKNKKLKLSIDLLIEKLDYQFNKDQLQAARGNPNFDMKLLNSSQKNELKAELYKLITSKQRERTLKQIQLVYGENTGNFHKTILSKKLDPLFEEVDGVVNFYSPKGVCKGASDLFISLLSTSFELFEDKEKLLIAVAEQFKSGVPSQGGVFQAIYHYYRPKSLDSNLVKAPEIEFVRPGIYQFIFETSSAAHALVYINFGDWQYIFDPNIGLIRMSKQEIPSFVKNQYNASDLEWELYKDLSSQFQNSQTA